MLNTDSTSSREREFAERLYTMLATDRCKAEKFEVGDGTLNLLFSWGKPDIVFCTHLDTVPPYFPPAAEPDPSGSGLIIKGRGSCDAKGQIFAMYSACKELEAKGYEGFGLLLLAGEETGSFGAKSFRDTHAGGRYVIVGEPTDNCMASASKGTKAFEVTLRGKSFHSGYPQYGESAVEKFVDLMNRIRSTEFPEDPVLGKTTWNVGKLISDNPQNILSDCLKFRIYFRTTFASDKAVCEAMEALCGNDTEVKAFGGDTPMKYTTLDGFKTATVSFGSDAPQLTNFRHKILCGPGSILVAHTGDEQIRTAEIEEAIENYVRMFEMLKDIEQNN